MNRKYDEPVLTFRVITILLLVKRTASDALLPHLPWRLAALRALLARLQAT